MKSLRIAILVLIGALELTATITSLIDYNVSLGEFGFITGRDRITVVQVLADFPAARAGMEPGDRIVYKSLSLQGKRLVVFDDQLPAGTRLDFSLEHNGRLRKVTLVSEAVPRALSQIVTIAYALSGLALGIVSLTLVALRPSRMTWAFAALAPPMVIPYELYFWGLGTESAAAVAFDISMALLYGAQACGILVFASRFPNDRTRGFTRVVDYLGLPAGAFIAGVLAYAYLAVRYSPAPPPHFVDIADWSVILPSVAALCCFISTYATTSGSARTRLAPAIGSFVILILSEVVQQLGSDFTADLTLTILFELLYAVAPALVALAIAYGVIRHRVIDVNFIISRTLVYTILTVFVVTVFALIDYIVGKLLEEQRLAQVMEVGAAIAIGVSMNYLHGWLDRFLDVAFFRKRHAAEVRLEAAARTLPHAESLGAIGEMLVAEPVDALGLASAAVFRRDGDRYVRDAASGWGDGTAEAFDRDDHLVVRLRSELEPVRLGSLRWPRADLPAGDAAPTLAVPIAFGHELEAVALYGSHAGGEDLDPDEQRSLAGLASGAALAYDRVSERELRDRVETLQAENAALRQVETKLTSIIEQHLKPT